MTSIPAHLRASLDQHHAGMAATVAQRTEVYADLVGTVNPDEMWLLIAADLAGSTPLNAPTTLAFTGQPITNLHLALAAAFVELARLHHEKTA